MLISDYIFILEIAESFDWGKHLFIPTYSQAYKPPFLKWIYIINSKTTIHYVKRIL